MEKLNVLLVEDDPLARQLIEMFIEKSERYAFETALKAKQLTAADRVLEALCVFAQKAGVYGI